MNNIIELMRNVFETLSPKLQRVASYIIEHHKEAAFLNLNALSRAAGVSGNTVIRLSYALNLSGFSALRQALQIHMRKYVSLPKYEPRQTGSFMLAEVAAMEKSIIDEMLQSISQKDFKQAVEYFFSAQQVMVVGTHYNMMPALYASYFLKAIRPRVHFISSLNIDVYSSVQETSINDSILAISTARYPKDTQKILAAFKNSGARIVSITDSEVSPVVSLSDISLIVPMKFMSYIDPYASVLVLIHAIISGVLVKVKGVKQSQKWLDKYDEFMDEQDFHEVKGLKVIDLNLKDKNRKKT